MCADTWEMVTVTAPRHAPAVRDRLPVKATVFVRARCTPCLGKSEYKHLEKCCPGRPFEPDSNHFPGVRTHVSLL